jgi:hypothetical protein
MSCGRVVRKSVKNSSRDNRGASMGALIIAYTGPGTRGPLSVATIHDPELLRQAAVLAINEAQRRALRIAGSDPVMARLQEAEVHRLIAALSILVPGLVDDTSEAAVVQ